MSRLNIFKKKKDAPEKKGVSKINKAAVSEGEKTVLPSQTFFTSERVILKRPISSEKAHDLMGQAKYVFLVEAAANKPLVKESVQRRYGVTVEAVNIVNLKGKAKKFAGLRGRKSAFKKASVTLGQGQKIEIT